jgi:hypothetical protein
MKTYIMRPPQNRRSGFWQKAAFLNEIMFAALYRGAATKPARPSMFSVQCWMLNVAVLAVASSALADVHYVDVNSTNATPPYSDWATAATNIQDAVDAALAGDEIVVTNGIYATGERDNEAGANRVAVDKPLTVRSVNGPEFTIIDGLGQIGCAYLTNGTSLSGFTLTNGYGGVVGDFWTGTATVSNCVISGNLRFGAFGCTLDNCTLSNNHATWRGGGAWSCTLNNCSLIGNTVDDHGANLQTEGGGAYSCTLNNCTLTGNSVMRGIGYNGDAAYGGGASSSTLNNCTLTGNKVFATDHSGGGFSVLAYGGGAYGSTLNNCAIVGNSASRNQPNNGHGIGGGTANCTLNNCIVCFNAAIVGTDVYGGGLDHCWTTSNPLFADTNGWANLRLQPNSPCINAGDNSYGTNATDLDGNPRISGGTVDIGAYEYQWPQLTLTPSGIPPSGIVLSWPTNNLGYDYTGFTMQSTTNLIPPLVWDTNSPAPVVIGGQNVVTNPITADQMFFRLSQ